MYTNFSQLFFVLIALLIAGCANPLNRATSTRYSEICSEAENRNNIEIAIEACSRAVANAQWGNLSPELKSEHLYNYGRVLRKGGRFDEAKAALLEALAIEEPLTGSASIKAGRRIAELSAVYYQLDQINEGATYLERILPIVDQYTTHERRFIAGLFYFYGKALEAVDDDNSDRGKTFSNKVKEMGYSENTFQNNGEKNRDATLK